MKMTLLSLAAITAIGFITFLIINSKRSTTLHPRNRTDRDLQPLTAHLFKEAISIVKSPTATKSYFGGTPPQLNHSSWPTRNGHPLSFLACIDCSELPRLADLDWLPSSGLLLFFYDIQDQPCGLDPNDRDGSATIYLPATEIQDRTSLATPPTPLIADAVLPKQYMAFQRLNLPPTWDSPELQAIGLTDSEMDLFMKQRASLYGNNPHHQIGGFADPVQNSEMDEECQLVSNGLHGRDTAGYEDPRAAKLKEGAGDWSLLFQMDTDDDLKIMWGDAGMIYFWVRREDARQLRFDNTWVILQCS